MADFLFTMAKKAVMVIQEYKKLKGQMSKCVRATHTTTGTSTALFNYLEFSFF